VDDLTAAISLDPQGSSALYYRALAWVGLSNKKSARDDIQAFLVMKPNNQQALALLQAVQD
jgi:regulator of sirC expression with transglutaminase-like and TPR domain